MKPRRASINQAADQKSLSLEWKGFQGRVKPGINTGPILEFIGAAPFAELPSNPRAQFVKAKVDKGSRVYRALLDAGAGEEELFFKTFNSAETSRVMLARMMSRKGLQRPFHYPPKLVRLLVEPSLARQCWVAAAACAQAGIPAAEHLLYLSRRRGFFREEVLVTRGVNPRRAPDARQFCDHFFRPPLVPDLLILKRQLIALLGSLLCRVRDSEIMFPDFKLHNLVVQEPAGGPPILVLIDLSEAVPARSDYPEMVFLERFSPSLPGPPVFNNADRVRLLKSYLRAGDDHRTWLELCRGIRQRAADRGRGGKDSDSMR